MFGWGRPLGLVLALAAICGATVCAPARAGIVSQDVFAAVHRGGLTAAERQAITIRSVTAQSDPSLGLLVTVTFAGDIERYLGQGDLKNGLVALVLEPSVVNQTPNGLLAEGGGYTRAPFTILARHGKRLTPKRGSTAMFSPERVLRTFNGGQYGVIRYGDQILFRLAGPVLADLGSVRVKAFVKSPLRVGQELTNAGWRAVVRERPVAVAALNVDTSLLSSPQLATVGTGLANVLSQGVQPELRSEQKIRGQLKTAIGQYTTVQKLIGSRRDLPRVSPATLSRELGNTLGRIGRLRTEVRALNGLSGEIQTLSTPAVQVVQTVPWQSEELSTQPGRPLSTLQPQGIPVINVNPQVRYQQFTGLGAAMTDSSAWLIYDELSPSSRLALLQALFGAPGTENALGLPAIHLNFLRLGIGAPGAMTVGAPYTYDDSPPTQDGTDPTLKYFSIGHDLPYIIPTLQQALAVNPGLQIFANPWSPPAWMKTENSLNDADGNNTLQPGDYPTFANYIVKFIQAYQSQGVPITAIAPQNEPSSALGANDTNYPGMAFSESDEAQFISQNLAPALQAAGLHPKLYGNVLSWNSTTYAGALGSSSAAGDLTGLGWHCYFGSPTAMTAQHQATPGLDQLVDECSPEIRGFGTPEFLISSLRNWASAVSVWSVALDPSGNPVQPGNSCPGCMGPVTINEQTQGITLRPEYYQLGQVSSFVQPGAVRIDSPDFVTYGLNPNGIETVSNGLDDVAFQNPDGSIVLVAYNNSPSATTFAVNSGGRYFTAALPGWAMTTFVWH